MPDALLLNRTKHLARRLAIFLSDSGVKVERMHDNRSQQRRTFFFSSRRRHTISVSAFLLNRSSDLSGRVQQTYKHSVPRFFVLEHGTMFTLALVRFPPTATKEIQYLNAKGALTYTDIAGRSEERRVGKEGKSRWVSYH